MDDRLIESHFLKLAHLVETHTGIRMPPSKRLMLEGRLRRRVRALGLDTLTDYGKAIFHDGRLSEEFEHLVDCVTTNKTDFFREPEHFVFLRDHAIPSALRLKRPLDSPIKLWSAAASIGAEAYSAAMVAADVLGRSRVSFSVLGTDLSAQVIADARRAVYALAMADPIPPAYRERFVMVARDARRLEVRIVPELRRRVQFAQMNLMDERYPFDTNFDIVFCRNVLIYFSKPVQAEVLSRLCGHLRVGGYLMLGHSESLAGAGQRSLKQVIPTIFRRVA
jgi:chemotaxis methyl-accepting protein methylase